MADVGFLLVFPFVVETQSLHLFVNALFVWWLPFSM